ncbi:MAG: chorismate mutase [Candidatus Levyibacteriota bacterium]
MKKIDVLRKDIDRIDRNIIKLLAKRIILVKKIGKIKKENEMKIFDSRRWVEVMEKVLTHSEEHGVEKKFTLSLYKLIHNHAMKKEEDQK